MDQNSKLSNYENEFEVIDYLLNSQIESRAIDSFSLSFLKIEKQIRKIFTHIIYQHKCFENSDKIKIINIISTNRNIYFKDVINGINLIYNKEIKEIYGGNFDDDFKSIINLKDYRNKIFHGQLTGKNLSRTDLEGFVTIMRKWSFQISKSFQDEINYDGFQRNSLTKSKKDFSNLLKDKISSLEDFEKLLLEMKVK